MFVNYSVSGLAPGTPSLGTYPETLRSHVPEPPGHDPDQPPDIPPPRPPDEDIDLPPREDPAPVRDPGQPRQAH